MKSLKSHSFIDIIKSSTTYEQLSAAMSDMEVPRTKNNCFADNIWLMQKTSDKEDGYSQFKINLDGLALVAFKVYYFLVMHGYFGRIPSLGHRYSSQMRMVLQRLCDARINMNSMLELNQEDIEHYIRRELGSLKDGEAEAYARRIFQKYDDEEIGIYVELSSSKEVSANTVYADISIITKMIVLDDILPSFLTIRKSIIVGIEYEMLKEAYYESKKKSQKPGNSPRKQYPLHDLGIVIHEAFDIIKNGNEILALAEYLKEKADFFNAKKSFGARYYEGCEAIHNSDISINHPSLKSFVQDIRMTNKYNVYNEKGIKKGLKFQRFSSTLTKSISLLESACVIVIMLMTAMRRLEFAKLSRVLNIEMGSEDEFLFNKLIYKTAVSTAGDEHTIPMTETAIHALKLLSRLSRFRDGKDIGSIITLAGYDTKWRDTESDDHLEVRLNRIVETLPKHLGLEHLSPHQLRHAIAYLIMHTSGKNGLEIVKYFLGHSSVLMTLTYLSRVNPFFAEVMEEVTAELSKKNFKDVSKRLKDGSRVYGMRAASFTGGVMDVNTFLEYWEDKIDSGMGSILFTPVCACVHDFNNPKGMKCQRGLDMGSLTGIIPAPAACQPDECASALFFEEHIEKMIASKKEGIDELEQIDMFKRLEENTFFFADEFKINQEMRYQSVIDQYLKNNRKAI